MKNLFSKSNILILTPLILVMVLDAVFTLAGQSEYYWQNYSLFNESSPLGQTLMLNPAYFILFFILYLPFVLFLATNLKKPFNIMIAIGFFLGHAWGSASWVPTIFHRLTGVYTTEEWWLTVGYFIVIAAISGLSIDKWLKTRRFE
jgi:hypothetical protein